MLKTVICDDEPPALELMASLLRDTGEIELVAACQSVREALDAINDGGVDLVVLDIEMPDLTGVDACGRITVEPRPLVIFATAHPEYAVEAFGVDAIDYILKPLDPLRVQKAVEKASRLRRFIRERESGAPIRVAQTAPADDASVLKIKDAGKLYFIPHAEIIWVEAAGDYSLLHLAGEREVTVRVTIKALESELPAAHFARVHRSAIVAASHIREITLLPKGEALIHMSDDASVRTSRSYRDVVQALTSGL
ncbi:LytR/AlgR family response regulator transcription factor [Amphiplicatus metriothermophilus]|uniref:Two component transcriptional regulator, LytTR family n=1 Tax=Amphiplicatus metriothermophilus TaxID=1519374 RepID=A0A239PR53_9PROT|nr:LytTR family DNA-binding domain-containing protein [Amphiplicatus metriothermophilus]MBB5518473.1 two-component system LytT family response regulator [Amphiplicatus metriothermophilus]SNT72366.1 two component transcriptional regulator, LytTR family [Amphiplicatus metriothermophilus]